MMAFLAGKRGALVCLLLAGCHPPTATISLPGDGSIAFDDLRYSARVHRVVVAAAQRRFIALVNPDDGSVETVDGSFAGVQSADEGNGWIFALDRSTGGESGGRLVRFPDNP